MAQFGGGDEDGVEARRYVVTEARFGADLGAEKFFDIKCRAAGLKPSAAVIVATIRALKMHGGAAKDGLGKANVEAVTKGCANLGRHIDNVKQFGVPVVVAINNFTTDTADEIAAVQEFAKSHGVEAILCEHWAKGSEGAEALAHAVVTLAESGSRSSRRSTIPSCRSSKNHADRDAHLSRRGGGRRKKIRDRCTNGQQVIESSRSHGEDAVVLFHRPELRARRRITWCVARCGFRWRGFRGVICGEIITMPGLPKVPAAETIGLDANGLGRLF